MVSIQEEVEDLVHFVLHCGSYATIRAEYSTLFQSRHWHGEGDAQVLATVFV